jgi:hypothetical protein
VLFRSLRPAALDDLLAEHASVIVAKVLEALAPLEGRLVESLQRMVQEAIPLAISGAASAVEFDKAIPGPVGVALEAYDDQVAEVLGDLLEGMHADGELTLTDVLDTARDFLASEGIKTSPADLLTQARRLIGV